MASDQQQQREGTPLSTGSGSMLNEQLAGVGGLAKATNRATTTERRTTTTTTTKRTIKSSDDFIPTATDIQQVRSESRTGSISSISSPLFAANPQGSTSTNTATSSSRQHATSTSGSTATTTTSSQQQQQVPSRQLGSTSTSSTTTTTTTSNGAATGGAGTPTAAGGGIESLQSPLIQDTEEGRILKLRFDVSQYEPEEIIVKTVDNRLTVQAKHEERSENRSVYREYNREFHLPDGTDIELIKSSLSKDGILTVDCPLPQLQLHGASRCIPIERI